MQQPRGGSPGVILGRMSDASPVSEQRYRALFESARDVVYTLSLDGRITSLNPAFEQITGWTCAHWIGEPFIPLLHPDDVAFAVQKFARVIQGETPEIFELRIQIKNGGYRVGEFLETPQWEKGVVIGVLGIARDITDRKSVETERQAMEKSLRGAHDLLEQKVQQRTHALELANKALHEKVLELEKFEASVIGRELKMIELEREIRRLKEELARQRELSSRPD